MQTSTRKRKAPFPAKRRRSTPSAYVPRRYTSINRPEFKFIDVGFNFLMNTTGAFQLLNGLVPGTGASQRIGTKISIKSIELRYKCISTLTTGASQLMRVLLVLDHQPNGVALSLLQVLVTVDTFSPRSLANRARFKLLHDKTHSISASGQDNTTLYNKIYMQFKKPIVVEYNIGVAGNIGDIVNSSIYVIAIGSEVAGPTAGTTQGFSRIRYIDN